MKKIIIFLLIILTIAGCTVDNQSSLSNVPTDHTESSNPTFINPDELISQEAMIEDINLLCSKMSKVHPKYNDNPDAFAHIDDYATSTIEKLPDEMSRYEFYYYLSSIVSMSNDPHCWVEFNYSRYKYWLDFQVTFLDDTIYVTSANDYFELGDEIIMIGSYNYDEILAALDNVISNSNSYGLLSSCSKHIQNMFFYVYLGVLDYQGNVTFTVKKQDGATEEITINLPDILKRKTIPNAREYSSRIDYDTNIAYLDIRSCSASLEFKTFMEDFYAKVKEENIEKIVIDFRNNPGGNKYFIYYLLLGMDIEKYYTDDDKLVKNHFKKDMYCSDADIYLFVSNETFSAAIIATAVLKRNNLVTIVGTPPGDTTKMYAYNYEHEMNNIFDNSYFAYSISTRTSFIIGIDEENIQPHIYIEPTLEDILSDTDPSMEWVRAQ